MQFVLTGFSQVLGFRVFAFEGINLDRTRTKFTVKTDLRLLRQYEIRIQDLPLLCRGLLERLETPEHALTFSESDMRAYAKERQDAKEAAPPKRSPWRRNSATPRT